MAQEEESVSSMDFDWKNPYSASKISRAIRSGSFDMVKKLVRKGCLLDMPDNRGWTPLHEAAVSNDYVDIAQLLISSGAYIDHKTVEGETPIYIACKHGCEMIAKVLIESGCNINAQNNECLTPLHIACSQKNAAVIQLLLDNNADINAKDEEERSPIYIALENVNTAAIHTLIRAGADLKTKDFFSRTPLQYACMIGNLEIFNILIEHLGCDKSIINQQTPEGWTLLMEACQYKHYLIAEKLIEYGIDTTLVDNRGLLALHIAAHCERYNLIELLLKHTPKDAIEKYSTFGDNMTHYRSLPCLIIDKNVFEGLELLFDSGLSEAVLKCPAKMGDRLVSPISFLLLHANAIDNEEKVKFLEFLLSHDFLIDPVYEQEDEASQDDNSIVDMVRMLYSHRIVSVSPIEAAVQMHRPFHEDCYCEKFLSMILAKGASPDKGLPCLTKSTSSSQLYLFQKAARYGFTDGLDLLLRYSECTEPDDVMEMFLRDIAEPRHLWTDQENVVTSFLLKKCTTNFMATVSMIRNSLAEPIKSDDRTRYNAILPIYKLVMANIRVVSLKRMCRFAIRKCIREQAQASSQPFRKHLSNIDLPSSLSRYLLYEVDF